MSETTLRRERFDRGEEFFVQSGSAWMKLSLPAAIKVAEQCSSGHDAISIIEGGIWRKPGFEARIDAIWHSEFEKRPTGNALVENNAKALRFLANDMPEECDTAIISLFKD